MPAPIRCAATAATLLALAAISHATEIGHPSFLSPHSNPIVALNNHVFVTNTPSDTVDVIDANSQRVIHRIDVGIDPVALAVRPDGKELWVSNHVSDSVSIIDLEPSNPTYLHVVATVQAFDPATKATTFDEPVGIAFASNAKAYVALSSENQIAVVDVDSRIVYKRLKITAQDPRAIAVRNGKLFVTPFESNNQTQLSGGYDLDDPHVTFNAHQHSIAVNNVLSIGHVVDIIKHPRVPDRDLYIFDTESDELIQTVDTLGTLLYGLAVDSKGNAFIAQADARNEINGLSGTKKHGLAELENRAFLNQVTKVSFDGKEAKPERFDLEPLPPQHPKPDAALATPFAVQVSDDDNTLFVSAASSDKLFTVDAKSGKVLGRADVGAVPRGIALTGQHAWVLNAVANTVALLDVSNPTALEVNATIPLHDPTHPAFKRGRIAFNTARASTTRSFSCASCHPDGHTDQLLWVLKTPVVTDGDQIMPRSTMPLRGLRDTAPFHWDGIPGAPYGGINSASTRAHVEPNADIDKPESATRHLIDGGLASTMLMDGDTTKNDEGKEGFLTAAERDDMAKFLLNITFPPAQRRAYTNELSDRAKDGFEQFHIKGDPQGTPGGNHCGNCHRMPFWVSTNTPGSGMDAPTWRGAYDRFLILPQGRLNIIDFDFYRRVAEQGNDERSIWQFSWGGRRYFDPVWDMVLEGSTGYSGAFARQVTVNRETANDSQTHNILDALERSAADSAVVLQATGVLIDKNKNTTPVTLTYTDGTYTDAHKKFPRAKLLEQATDGRFVGTFTARHGAKDDYDHPQPGLWTLSPIHAQTGPQQFPIVAAPENTMTINARHLDDDAHIIVDGRRVPGTITKNPDNENITLHLEHLPENGIHFLQVQNPGGLVSNDFIFFTANDEQSAIAARNRANPNRLPEALGRAVEAGNLERVKRLIAEGAPVNARRESNGTTPLAAAALRGNTDIVRFLLENKARPNHTNRDRNAPLHIAAFMCRTEVVELLLEHGANISQQNARGEDAIQVVTSDWNEGLANFYTGIATSSGFEIDLEEIQKLRPQIAERLRQQKR